LLGTDSFLTRVFCCAFVCGSYALRNSEILWVHFFLEYFFIIRWEKKHELEKIKCRSSFEEMQPLLIVKEISNGEEEEFLVTDKEIG